MDNGNDHPGGADGAPGDGHEGDGEETATEPEGLEEALAGLAGLGDLGDLAGVGDPDDPDDLDDLDDDDYIEGFISELEDDEDDDPPTVTVAKPDELLALHTVTAELFTTLRRWFGVPPIVPIDLQEIDSAVAELGDPVMIAALAMRKLQALNLLSTPGVMTTTDVVITIVQDLDRALVQAPNMRLKLQAAGTDWDAAFAALDTRSKDPVDDDDPSFGTSHPSRRTDAGAPVDATQVDPEAERFRMLHGRLHDAVFAVIDVSEGEIRYLI